MPASTPQEAQEKWERKVQASEDKWEDNVQNPSRTVAEGLADFWGGTSNDYSDVQSSYDDEVQDAIDTGRWADNVQGKGDKWRRAAERGVQDS